MSKQWGAGFHTGKKQGEEIGMEIGEKIGEAKTQMNIVMKALCMATAIRDAQKRDLVSQYVLLEALIDILASECGGRIYEAEEDKPADV